MQYLMNCLLFIYLFSYIRSSLLSLVVVSRGYSLLQCVGFSLWWLLLLPSVGSRRTGFSSCGTRVLERRLHSVAHGLSCSATCGIFPDQGSNRVPCIGKRILNHCTTREVLNCLFLNSHFLSCLDLLLLELTANFLYLPSPCPHY